MALSDRQTKGFFQRKLQDLIDPDTESTIGSFKYQAIEDNFCPDVATKTMLPNIDENEDNKLLMIMKSLWKTRKPLHVPFALRANSQKSKCWVFTLKNVSADKPSPTSSAVRDPPAIQSTTTRIIQRKGKFKINRKESTKSVKVNKAAK